MKLFLFILLFYFTPQLYAQSYERVSFLNGTYHKYVLNDGTVLYHSQCSNEAEFNFLKIIYKRSDSLHPQGILSAYNFDSTLVCLENTDTLLFNLVNKLSSSQKNIASRVLIIQTMKDNAGRKIVTLYLFSSKKFHRFFKDSEKRRKVVMSGEVVVYSRFNYKRFSTPFILIQHDKSFKILNAKFLK